MRVAVLLAVAAGLVALGTVLWRGHEPRASPDPGSERSADRAAEPATPPPAQRDGPDAHDGDHEPLVATDDVWRDLADPTHSDLSPEEFDAATQTAVDVIIADATGQGRDRWPDYWPAGGHRPCCTEITIHGATARTHPRHERLATAIVAWSAPIPDAADDRERLTTLVLSHRGGEWQPVRAP